MTVWLRFAVSLIAVSLPSSTAGGDAPPNFDPVLHTMPTTKAETKIFLEHVALLGKRAINASLDDSLPAMFHDQPVSPFDATARDEIGDVLKMLYAHTETVEGNNNPTRRRLRAENALLDATKEDLTSSWEMDWSSGIVSLVASTPQHEDLRNQHVSNFLKNKPRVEHQEDTVTVHFPGSIDATQHSVRHQNPETLAKRAAATRAEAPAASAIKRRRLAQTTTPCFPGSTTYSCATTISITEESGGPDLFQDGTTSKSDVVGTYSILPDAPACGQAPVYKHVSKNWFLYRYKTWTSTFRRWILTDVEWDARGCRYVGKGSGKDVTSTSGNVVLFFTTTLQPQDIGEMDFCSYSGFTGWYGCGGGGFAGGNCLVSGTTATPSVRTSAPTTTSLTFAVADDNPISLDLTPKKPVPTLDQSNGHVASTCASDTTVFGVKCSSACQSSTEYPAKWCYTDSGQSEWDYCG